MTNLTEGKGFPVRRLWPGTEIELADGSTVTIAAGAVVGLDIDTIQTLAEHILEEDMGLLGSGSHTITNAVAALGTAGLWFTLGLTGDERLIILQVISGGPFNFLAHPTANPTAGGAEGSFQADELDLVVIRGQIDIQTWKAIRATGGTDAVTRVQSFG